MPSNPSDIIIAAGGTGGHFFPGIATYHLLRDFGYKPLIVTDTRCTKYLTSDKNILSSYVIDIKISNKNLTTKIASVISILKTMFESTILLIKKKPKLIVGFGGYPTFPILFAGLLLRIPIILHEQNSIIGRTNLFYLKFAKKIAISYQNTKNIPRSLLDKVVLVEEIVRQTIAEIDKSFSHNIAKQFNILVFGGSQSAKIFSLIVPQAIAIVAQQSPDTKIKITQQASQEEQESIANIYNNAKIDYELSEFFHDIDQKYKNNDLVISRSGASTIAELSAIGLPAIFVPYPFSADDHQLHNALSIVQISGSWCIEQSKLTPEILAQHILDIINHPELLQLASQNLLQRNNHSHMTLLDVIQYQLS